MGYDLAKYDFELCDYGLYVETFDCYDDLKYQFQVIDFEYFRYKTSLASFNLLENQYLLVYYKLLLYYCK